MGSWDNKSPRIWDYGATSYRNAVSGSPLAGWMIHLMHTTHVSPTNEGYQTDTHIHKPICRTCQHSNHWSDLDVWLSTCLSLIYAWKWSAVIGVNKRINTGHSWVEYAHLTSCDSGCLPTVAREHSYSACWMAGIRYLDCCVVVPFSTTLPAIICTYSIEAQLHLAFMHYVEHLSNCRCKRWLSANSCTRLYVAIVCLFCRNQD